jgi:hypothetical protein
LSLEYLHLSKLKIILIILQIELYPIQGSMGNLTRHLQSNPPAKWQKKITACSIEQFLTDGELLVLAVSTWSIFGYSQGLIQVKISDAFEASCQTFGIMTKVINSLTWQPGPSPLPFIYRILSTKKSLKFLDLSDCNW